MVFAEDDATHAGLGGIHRPDEAGVIWNDFCQPSGA